MRNNRRKNRKERMARERNFHCYFCGNEYPISELEYEHLMPISRGGTDSNDNMELACRFCNRDKGCKTEEEYWEYRALVFHIIHEWTISDITLEIDWIIDNIFRVYGDDAVGMKNETGILFTHMISSLRTAQKILTRGEYLEEKLGYNITMEGFQ